MNNSVDELMQSLRGFLGRAISPLVTRVVAVERALADLPRPERGEKGDPGRDGKDGVPGTKGDPGQTGPAGAQGPAGPAGERGADGPPGATGSSGRDGVDGKDGAHGEKGLQGPAGPAGEPGRDAAQVEVLEHIDPAKSYPRGTFAAFRGGLVRSFKTTDPLPADGDLERSGWHTVVRGLGDVAIELAEDLRSISVRMSYTDGSSVEKTLRSPAVIYRGIWQEGGYQQGDAVTRDGSTWIAKADTESIPGAEGSAWQLSTKRGRDGRDGVKGEKGERGAQGRDAGPMRR